MVAVRFVLLALILSSTVPAGAMAARGGVGAPRCVAALIPSSFQIAYNNARLLRAQAELLLAESAKIGRDEGRLGENEWVDAATGRRYSEYQPITPAAAVRRHERYLSLRRNAEELNNEASVIESEARSSLKNLSFARTLFNDVLRQLLALDAAGNSRRRLVAGADLRNSLLLSDVLLGSDFTTKIEKRIKKALMGGVAADDLTVGQTRDINRRLKRLMDLVWHSNSASISTVRNALQQDGGILVWSVLQVDFGGGVRPDVLMGYVRAKTHKQAEAAMWRDYAHVPDKVLQVAIGETLRARRDVGQWFQFIPVEVWERWASERAP